MADFTPYIGLPYAVGSTDCWGLVRMIYADHLGIHLPAYLGVEMGPAVGAIIDDLLASRTWEPVETAQPYDLILLRDGSRLHIGIVIEPGKMIHTMENKNACIENYTRPYWASLAIGFYRYAR